MQKNAPEHLTDDVIDRHVVPKEGGGTTTYPVVRDPEAIVAFANLGVITFHAPPSTVDSEEQCDWIIWDLDPVAGDFIRARQSAHELRSVLEAFQIDTMVMTSGSNGYHLRAALQPRLPVQEAALIARGTAALAAAEHPELMTLAFRKKDRGDRVFVDWLRNAPYSTSVVPWSLRARAGAPVAVPIAWEEIDEVDPNGVVIGAVPNRLEQDPWGDISSLDLGQTRLAVENALEAADIVLEPFDRFRS